VLVICAGGGGIPVVRDATGRLHGAPAAVVDKDLSSALLAGELAADHLLLLTDVPCVYADWPTARRQIVAAPPRALAGREFDSGSMAPKVEAARHFVQGSGGVAHIGAVADAGAMLRRRAGTRIDAEASTLEER
jgi:carbamate kinase